MESAKVVERSEVDDAVASTREPARSASCREQQSLVRVGLARVVGCRVRIEIEADDLAARVDIDFELRSTAPDRALVLPGPQSLRERRPGVRRVRLGREEADRADRVVVANARHAASAVIPPPTIR